MYLDEFVLCCILYLDGSTFFDSFFLILFFCNVFSIFLFWFFTLVYGLIRGFLWVGCCFSWTFVVLIIVCLRVHIVLVLLKALFWFDLRPVFISSGFTFWS